MSFIGGLNNVSYDLQVQDDISVFVVMEYNI